MKKNVIAKSICAVAMGVTLMLGTVPAIAYADVNADTVYGEYGPAINSCKVSYNHVNRSMSFDQDYTFDKRVMLDGGAITFDIKPGVTVDAPYGITVGDRARFFVTGGGTLRVEGMLYGGEQWNGYAGIGGDPFNTTVGRIEIADATVYAEGGAYAAGIGGTFNSDAGTIVIDSNADVTAFGGLNAAGIGGGWNGTANDVDIKGTVKAFGGCRVIHYDRNGENHIAQYNAPAIGSGNFYTPTGDRSCFNVKLEEGAKITAQRSSVDYTETIGAGNNVTVGTVENNAEVSIVE